MKKGGKVKKVLVTVLAVVGVIAIVAVIAGSVMAKNAMGSMEAQYEAWTVERGGIDRVIQGTGSVESADVESILAWRGGKIQDLSAEAGDRVEAGQILFTVYDEALENQITAEQNAIEQQNITISKLKSGLKSYKVYAPADGTVSELYAQKGEDASSTVRTYGALCLLDTGEEQPISVTGAGRVSKIYVSKGDAVKRGDLLFSMDSTDVSKSIEAAELAISISEENIEKAEAKMADNATTVPVSGVLSAFSVQEGQQVTAGMAVGQVVSTTEQQVVIEVDELDIPLVKLGQEAVIRVDALEDREFSGRVEKIAELGLTMGGITTYDVTIALEDPEDIRIGMSCSAEIIIDTREKTLILPVDAVTKENGKRYVKVLLAGAELSDSRTWKKNEAGEMVPYELREVEMGLSNELEAEILSGVAEGETVLVEKENAMLQLMRQMQQQRQAMMGGN